MVKKIYKRRKFIIHHSIQVRYILLSVLPALAISIFCVFFLVKSGENMILRSELELNKISKYTQMLNELEGQKQPIKVLEKILTLKIELLSFQKSMQKTYLSNFMEWINICMQILIGLFIVSFLVMILAIIYSHRIAGPIYRVKRYLDMMAESNDLPPPISFREYDEFKEIADSVNKVIEKIDTESKRRSSKDLK
ncbi:MAG: hypothetical protein KAI91_06115 [Candidatus Omnitrophica bacterium]|nr:hypothetical protein [Candidatus Omnitrophota bacterium]MCK5393895.1 hypothetical protein [Candidatus Omnitrophota bacterium]